MRAAVGAVDVGLRRIAREADGECRLVAAWPPRGPGGLFLWTTARPQDLLAHELAVLPEHLDAVVGAIGEINQSIARADDAVRCTELRRRRSRRQHFAFRSAGIIACYRVIRLFPVSTPMSEVLTCCSVEDDDSTIAVA